MINKNIEERHVEIVKMKTTVSKIKTQEKLMLVEWIKWKTDEIKDKLENRQRSLFKIVDRPCKFHGTPLKDQIYKS